MKPLVTIGMPIYNAEKYLSFAIESILSQDYEHIELIISDNASTDSSHNICDYFASIDSRIQYTREEINKGSAFNFEKVLKLASGKYFMWAAHDDLFDKTYISKCVSMLDRYPNAIECVSDVMIIDENGMVKRESYDMLETMNKSLEESIGDMFKVMWWLEMYGLYRTSSIKQHSVDFYRFGSDVTFVLNTILRGDIVKVKEPLFLYRVPDKPKSSNNMSESIAPLDSSIKKTPYTDLAKDLIQQINTSKLPESQKEKLLKVFFDTIFSNYRDWMDLILEEHCNIQIPVSKMEKKELALEILLNKGESNRIKTVIIETNMAFDDLRNLAKTRSLYIWGAGSSGVKALDILLKKNINVSGFIDRDLSKKDLYIRGFNVITPQILFNNSSQFKKRPFILIASIYANEISCSLEKEGFVNKIDYLEY